MEVGSSCQQKNVGGEDLTATAELVEDYGYRPNLVWNAGVQEYLSKAYGQQHFAEICLALTRPTITSTVRVNTQQADTQQVMAELRNHFKGNIVPFAPRAGAPNNDSEADLGFTQELTPRGGDEKESGESCNQGIDFKAGLNFTESKGELLMDEICWEHPVLKDVVMVRGHGPCNVECRDGRGRPLLKEVVVSRKCAEAVLRGANVFVPGVLACSLHVEKGDEVAVTAAVERPDSGGGWSVGITRGTTLESEHAKAQLKGATRYDWFIGKGRVTMSRAALFKEIRGVAVEMTERVFDLPPFHGLFRGRIFLQNLPSIVATRVLDPQPGERILDMCAAPGGKTTAIAMQMKDKGEIIALDRSHHKVLEIERLSEEMMLTCIQAYKMDATKAVQRSNRMVKDVDLDSQALCHIDGNSGNLELALEITTATQPNGEPHHRLKDKDSLQSNRVAYTSDAVARKQARTLKNMSKRGQRDGNSHMKGLDPQSFDRVLLDAPCSALGLRPRLFAGEETLEGLRSHACYQRKMLDQAVQLVRPGGILVYSTCTLNPGENEGLVRYALDTYDFLSLVPPEPRIGGPGLVGGLNVFDGMSFKEWLREDEKALVQRFSPTGDYDTIGFFIAKFKVTSRKGQFNSPMTAD